MLRLRIDGDVPEERAEGIRRALMLVASVTAVTFDCDLGEVVVHGDPDEHLVLVTLATEGIAARPVHEAPRHPDFRAGLGRRPAE
ncbi:hypothetical protein M0638_07165 [Roseomonas sp. NAR14]|uniref:HMA domain-containing protein n=1 Tax=Roseomonas acroporae TaxID=2937791 RepID=A0A9X2BVM4_9PROT|nr:hypothetical protein [Roseomonas acroporae]MCK8784154.1 hypothetical protein [Roseomonas acroporae]